MASPHVAGAAALYLQNNPSASPTEVMASIGNSATTQVVSDEGTGSPNSLLYTYITTAYPSATPTPITSITPTPTTISGDIIPPVITITAPLNGALVGSKGNLKVSSRATDASGISSITMQIGITIIKRCTGTTSCSGNVSLGTLPPGTHTITATAVDSRGNSASSSISIFKR
jgi:hypothetical protein